jgi:UDP-2,3-diacylglucosamine pyrophosphatase LpxH
MDAALASPRAPYALPDDDVRPQERFRAIFISDVHLGTPGCQAERLLEFLRQTESDELYLVGDIIDGWQLRRRWFWRQSHNDVVQKVLRKARKGTHVIYVVGNHDEAMQQFEGLAFGGIQVAREAVHLARDGRLFLVTHGDRFDAVVQNARWLAHLGDGAHRLVLHANHWFNRARARLGLPYWSLAQFLKLRVKNAVNYIGEFERALASEARRRRYDGVICGHIHKAEVREIEGIAYANSGDWVESLTALVETEAGEFRVIDWKAARLAPQAAAAGGALANPHRD